MMLLLVSRWFGPSFRSSLRDRIAQWPEIARITRSLVLVEREKALHARRTHTRAWKVRDAFPPRTANVIKAHPWSSLLLAQAVLLESALSYLGAGPQRPFRDMGRIISDGQDTSHSWWLVTCRAGHRSVGGRRESARRRAA